MYHSIIYHLYIVCSPRKWRYFFFIFLINSLLLYFFHYHFFPLYTLLCPAITTLLSMSMSPFFSSCLIPPPPNCLTAQICQPAISESVSILLVSSICSLDYTWMKSYSICLSLTGLIHLIIMFSRSIHAVAKVLTFSYFFMIE